MKSIMISIQPQWVDKIDKREKIDELRTRIPQCELPYKAYIYETKGKWLKPYYNKIDKKTHYCQCEGRGKVVSEFIVYEYDKYTDLRNVANLARIFKRCCVDSEKVWEYSKQGTKPLYALHIDDLKIYDSPRELSEFYTICKETNCCYCPYHYHENNASIGVEEFCMSDGIKPLTRPFQSWGYVEELED